MKRLLIGIFCILSTLVLWAQSVSFQASAPGQVAMGRPFQVVYSVNQQAADFRLPSFAGFDVLAGPYSSTSMQSQYVGGQYTTQYSQTYTMTIQPTKEGTFTIAPATISVGGKSYSSNAVKITVLPADNSGANNTGGNSNASSGSTSARNTSNGESVFVKAIVSKNTVWEQQPVLVTYKIYFAGCDIAQYTPKLPDFKGFVKQEIDLGEIQAQMENYNGRNYQTAVLYQALLYPQQSGDIVIDPATYETALRVRTRAQIRSIFDDFIDMYTNVERTLKTGSTTIHVKKLPTSRPADYTGGVGQFKMDHTISSTEVTTNDAITLRLNISGKGNLKLLNSPKIQWPEGFEVYDPKINNNLKTTSSGISGTKTIEYLVIPRASGTYTLPAITLSYFDPEDGSYKSLSTPEYAIHVAKGEENESTQGNVTNYTNRQDLQEQNTDIRYIHTKSIDLQSNQSSSRWTIVTGSLLHWMLYVLPLIIAIILFIIFRKQIQENANITRVRYKRANKTAQKRLKTAKRLMQDPSAQAAFYEEIERASLSYLSDRLLIPTAELNKETITSVLRKKGVEETLIEQVNCLLSTAEFARYAPASDHTMQDMYDDTVNIINQLENQKL